MLIKNLALVHYDLKKKTRLYVDHGPVGLGAVLTQWHELATRATGYRRPIIHTSSALNEAEQNYGKTDGGSLAILYGVKKHRNFLYGTEFKVINDHTPLVSLYNNPARPAPTRVERHRGKLRQFGFTVKYEPRDTSPADYGSRHPKAATVEDKAGIETEADEEIILVNRVVEISTQTTVSMEQIKRQYEKNLVLKKCYRISNQGAHLKRQSHPFTQRSSQNWHL